MSLFKQGLRDSSVYMLAALFVHSLALIVIPILTRTFSVEQFAIYDLFILTNTFLIAVVGLGMDSGLAILLAESVSDQKKLSFLFVFTLVVNLIVTVITWLIFSFFIHLYFVILFSKEIWHLLFIYTFFSLITYNVFNFVKWIGKAKQAALIQVLSALFGVLIGLILVLFVKTSIVFYFVGLIIGSVIGSLLSLFIVRDYIINFSLIPDWKKLVKELFGLSLPYMPSYIGHYLFQFTDRMIVLYLLDMKTVGIYALIARVATIPSLLVHITSTGFLPVMMKNYNSYDGAQLIRVIFKYYFILIALAFILFIFLSNWIIIIFGGNEEYINHSYLLAVLAASVLFMQSVRLTGIGFNIARKTIQVLYITYLALIINLSLSYILGQFWGLDGVVLATLIASFFRSYIHNYFSEKVYSFDYQLRYIIVSFIFVMSLALILTYYNN
jgi:O-antigen/teichoic acid export membrane protein